MTENTTEQSKAPAQAPAPAEQGSSSGQPAGGAAPAATDSRQSTPGRGGRGGRGSGGGRRGGGQGRRGPRQGRGREKAEFESKTLDLARVSRVTKGGKRFSFRATVVIGDQKSRVGVGIGKGQDVQKSIQKAYMQAKKNLLTVTTVGGTIPYQVEAKYSSARVLLKPSKGGIKAGGAVRVVAQLAGIHSMTGKNLGRTNNKLNIARAAIVALTMLRKNGAAAAHVRTSEKQESDTHTEKQTTQ